jgi:predicted transcriptional regulator of viral defense system
LDAIEHFLSEFTIADVETTCPTVSRDTIRSVLNEMRDRGKVECLGKGRWAKWKRIV